MRGECFDPAETAGKIERRLRERLSPSLLRLEDQSHLHAGHREAGRGGHFYVEIQSARFDGLTPLARQRLVISCLSEMMDREIHALSMRCLPSRA